MKPDEVIYCVDLDDTGSMHSASRGDPGAIAYIRSDLVDDLSVETTGPTDPLYEAMRDRTTIP